MNYSRFKHGCGISLLCLMAGISSQAQAQPETQAPPLEDDSAPEQAVASDTITVDAELDLALGYLDNIFATQNDEVSDLIGIARPRLDILAKGENYQISVTGRGEIGRYESNSAEDYDDWQIGLNSRARLSSGLTLVGGGDYRWDHENRSSPEDVNGLNPTEYQRGYGFAGMLWNKGDLSARIAGTVTDLNFSDIASSFGTINNDDRDRVHYELGGRFGHKLSSDTDIFVQAAYDERRYDDDFDDFGFARSSDGYSAALGLRHKFSSRLSAEIYAGILEQNYDSPLLPDVSIVDFGALLDWRDPTGISATVRVDRTVEETTLPGASAYILTSGQLSLRAINTPRFTSGVNISGSHYDYIGASRSEFVTSTGLWARYWLDKRIYLGADYDFAQRTSNRAGFDYDENRLFLRIGAQLEPRKNWDAASQFSFSGQSGPGGAYGALLFSHGTVTTGLDGPRGNGGSNTADFGDDGAAVVAAAGYGFVTGPIYLGLEVEGQLAGPEWNHIADRVFSVEKKEGFGASLRLGYVNAGSDLVYGRFGVVSSRFQTVYDHTASSVDISERETGLGFGMGVEAGFGSHGFVRAEYSLVSYDDYDVPTGQGDFDNFSNSENQFRIGIGFRLGKNADTEEPAHDFSGAYAGVQFGHGSLISQNFGFRTGGVPIDISRSSSGPVFGLLAGAGFTWQKFYLGAEVDADLSNIDWNIDRDPSGRIFSTEHEYSFGGSARLGYQISNSALLYGRIGAVRTKFDTQFSTSNVSVREKNWDTGTRFGGGVELGLSSSTRLRFDYTHTDYGAFDIEADQSVDRFDNSENLFRIAITFKL
tara:strand:+ start:4703 stop:7162 length:2460 start_codon:yes stop_codon:yes gene_type:complete